MSVPPSPGDRASAALELQNDLLRTAWRLLELQGRPPRRVRVRVTGGRRGDVELSYRTRRMPPQTPAECEPMLALTLLVLLSPAEREILLALGEDTLAAPAINQRMYGDREPTAKTKTLLANLCDRRVLELTREGYRVTDRRLLAVARGPDGGTTAAPNPSPDKPN
jgi:hypothetical protein